MGVADKTSAPNPRSCIKTIQETRRISFGVATPSVLRQFEITASTNIRDTPILQCHAFLKRSKRKVVAQRRARMAHLEDKGGMFVGK